jgi:hypothetical protein
MDTARKWRKGMLLTLSRDSETTFRRLPVLGVQAVKNADGGRAPGNLLDLGLPTRARPETPSNDIVEEWGMQSFPASDPPANW